TTNLKSCRMSGNAPVAQLDRASDFESGGRGFESLRARSFLKSQPPAANLGSKDYAGLSGRNVRNEVTMYSRSSFVLAFGFGTLGVLIAVLGFGAIRRADMIYAEVQSAQESYLQTEAFRRGIVTDLYLADILVRDYLLDPSPENVQTHRQELLNTRDSLQQRLDHLSELVGETESPRLARLQDEVEGYWESLDPVFDWTVQKKSQQGWVFLRRKVLPRRQAVVNLAREMARINDENLSRARQRVQSSQEVLHKFLLQMMTFTLGLGIIV